MLHRAEGRWPGRGAGGRGWGFWRGRDRWEWMRHRLHHVARVVEGVLDEQGERSQEFVPSRHLRVRPAHPAAGGGIDQRLGVPEVQPEAVNVDFSVQGNRHSK